MRYQAVIGEQEIEISVEANGRIMEILLADSGESVDYQRISAARYSILIGGKSYSLQVEKNNPGFEVTHRNQAVEVLIKDEIDLIRERYGMGAGLAEMHGIVKAPIPGKVVKIEVEEGQTVEPDTGLMILEAMKMENEIKAPVGGVIAKIFVSEGDNLDKDAQLLEIETE